LYVKIDKITFQLVNFFKKDWLMLWSYYYYYYYYYYNIYICRGERSESPYLYICWARGSIWGC